MIAKYQLYVTAMTMIGVWTNMFINLKRVNEINIINDNKKPCPRVLK